MTGRRVAGFAWRTMHPLNTFRKKPDTDFLLYDNAIYSNIRV